MKILIVDDDANDRYFLRVSLEHYGASVCEAEDGAEALRKAREERPELIISDALMPMMDGFQLLRAVKEEEGLKAIPFIFYSATYTGPDEARLALSLGAEAFIAKPQEPQKFWERILAVLEKTKTNDGQTPGPEILEEETAFLRQYAHIVVTKLEKKVKSLEKECAARKEAEAALRESEEFITSILENIPNMIFVKDARDLRFVRFNKAGEELLGYRREDLCGKTDHDLFPGEEAAFFTAKDREALSSRKLVDIPEEPIETLGKGRRILHTIKVPIVDARGTPKFLLGVSEDVTERKQVEERTRILAELVDIAPAAITVHDPEGNYLYANQTNCDLHGYSKEEFLALNLHELDVPEDERLIASRMQELRGGKQLSFEVRHYRKDRSVVPLQIFAKLTEWGGKKVILSVASDITERKRADEALREAAFKYRVVANNTSAWEFWLDPEGRFLYTSTAGESITGRAAEEFMSYRTLLREIVHPEDRGLFDDHRHEALQEKRQQALQFRIIRPDGEIHWMDHVCQPVFDEGGTFLGTRGSNRDITESKRAEDTLYRSEERYRALVEASSQIVWTTDARGRIAEYPPSWQAYTGQKLEGKGGHEYAECFHPEDREAVTERWEEGLRKGESVTAVLRLRHHSGEWRWNHVRAVPIRDKSGAVVSWVGAYSDIHERKRAEDAMRSTLAEKEVLLKEVQHRVKNNMQIISSLLNLQAKKIQSPELKVIFDETRSRIQSMSFIHEMLYETKTFAKININHYMNKLVRALVSAAKPKAYEMRTTIDIGDIVLGVDTAIPLGLITNELVTNALKYAFFQERGAELTVSLTRADDLLTLSVKDNGPGLPVGFDHRDTNTLGLQLVAVMVRQIGGTFNISSKNGTETVVTFREI